ncbi:hypothetical protein [Winogradskyella sp. A3E31]|uniref:hypothetical protein n=1 Tax=Winogradskyella sp. A3E31 TaxID=3349637 RepID=UPI00398AF62E
MKLCIKKSVTLIFILFTFLPLLAQTVNASDSIEAEFNKISKEYQNAYMNANCEVLMPYLSEDLVIFENGEYWPYEKVKTYCPKIPVKPVLSTDRAYKIISDTMVYEFVSQMYQRQEGSQFNETASRLWEYNDGSWKIIQMDISRYPIKIEN